MPCSRGGRTPSDACRECRHRSEGGNDGGYSFGVFLSTYMKNGNKWSLGGEYLLKNSPYNDVKIPVAQFTAKGSYHFKVLSDVRKIVFLYASVSALAGYETVNWDDKVLYDGAEASRQ